MYERKVVVKRIVYVSKCECGETDVRESNPPKERQCKCGKWVKYKEESYEGPELGK